ncbi:MAG: cupin domain-containing protein [Bosea sp. (in: a-proteobacteria)]
MSVDFISATPAAEWHVDTLTWQEVAPDGTRYSLLEGRRDKAGEAFSYAFFIPAGFWDPPHWHTADARVFVAKGTLYLGYGDAMNRASAKAYPAGSYVIVPGGHRHFDGSNEDTLILGMALGPWSTHYVDPSHSASAGTPVA